MASAQWYPVGLGERALGPVDLGLLDQPALRRSLRNGRRPLFAGGVVERGSVRSRRRGGCGGFIFIALAFHAGGHVGALLRASLTAGERIRGARRAAAMQTLHDLAQARCFGA
jgi:hypothetical protein